MTFQFFSGYGLELQYDCAFMDSKVVLGSVTEMISQNTVYSLYNPQLAQLAISVYVGALFLTVVNYR